MSAKAKYGEVSHGRVMRRKVRWGMARQLWHVTSSRVQASPDSHGSCGRTRRVEARERKSG